MAFYTDGVAARSLDMCTEAHLDDLAAQIDQLEAELRSLECALPPPPPRMFVIPATAHSRALPLFFANHRLLSFANEELRKAFFQWHSNEEDDEDRMTPVYEAEVAEESQLQVVDRAFAALRMKRPQLNPKRPASKPLPPPRPGALRFTI